MAGEMEILKERGYGCRNISGVLHRKQETVGAPLRGVEEAGRESAKKSLYFNGRERIQNIAEVQTAEQMEFFINGRDMEGGMEI